MMMIASQLDIRIYFEDRFTEERSGEFLADASDLDLRYGQEPPKRIGIILDTGTRVFGHVRRVTSSNSAVIGWIYRSIEKGSFSSITIFNA
jgi:hypothetical protein